MLCFSPTFSSRGRGDVSKERRVFSILGGFCFSTIPPNNHYFFGAPEFTLLTTTTIYA